MRKLRTTMIADSFFRILEEKSIVVSEKKSLDGYFIWKTGKDSVWHFKVKGAKRWKFGLWINRKDSHGRKFKISVFIQHEDEIDKFKPSYSPYEVEFDLNLEKNDWEKEIYRGLILIENGIINISRYPVFMKYLTYGVELNFFRWWIGDTWFFRVEKPIRKFRETILSKYEAKFFGFLIKCRFPRLKTFVKEMPDYWYPKCKLHVCYDYYLAKGEGVSRVYHSRYMRAIENFINKHCSSWRMVHYDTMEDNRGFYFKKNI